VEGRGAVEGGAGWSEACAQCWFMTLRLSGCK
jgi:hypothetical protein